MKTCKRAAVLVLLLIMASSGLANMIVHDPAFAAQNMVQQAQEIVQQTEIQLNSLHSYMTEAEQLLRFGDFRSLTSIPGISDVAGLANSAGQLANDVNTLKGMVNPESYQGQLSGMLSPYGGGFSGYTSPGGVSILPNNALYSFSTSQNAVAGQIESSLSAISAQRGQIANEIANDAQALQSASDQATVEKLNGAIEALKGADQQLAGRQAELQSELQIFQTRIQATRAAYLQSVSEQANAAWQRTSESALAGTPVANHAMVTAYAYPGDATPDSQSGQGIGAFSFDDAPHSLVPYGGASGPVSAALTPSEARALRISPGQTFSVPINGQDVPLIYGDKTPQYYKGRNLGNRIDVYDPNGLLGGNSFSTHVNVVNVSHQSIK